jgi:hypothetical protein
MTDHAYIAGASQVPGPAPALRPRSHRRTILLGWPLVALTWLSLVFMTSEARWVWTPGIAVVSIAVLFVTILWDRDRRLPVFELGTLKVAATAVYALFPLMNYAAAGFTFTDERMVNYAATPREVGTFAWSYVIYLASFCAIYLLTRARVQIPEVGMMEPSRHTRVVFAAGFVVATAYIYAIQIIFQFQFNPSYAAAFSGQLPTVRLPYFLQQVSHNVWGILFVLKLGLLTLLFGRWHSRGWRFLLIGWLLAEGVMTVLRLGARSHLVLMLLAAILLYHRLVKPLSMKRAAVLGILLLSGFILLGLVRQHRGEMVLITENVRQAVTANNEFQVLFGTAYDIAQRREEGTLGPIPWQVFAGEAFLIIPSQLLPFEKWYPAEWYLEVIGIRGQGLGYMFGVLSHAEIGLGWLELVLRGAVLAFAFGLFHRYYARHASSFWATYFYLFLAVWAYYTFRASTFEIIYVIVYRFVPVIVLTVVGAQLIRLGRHTRRALRSVRA